MKLPTSSFILASLASSALSKVTFDRRQDRQYPAQYEVPDTSVTPQAWTDAYNAAKAQGKIAGIPPSTMDQNGNINYPDNLNNDPGVCSWTTIKCYGPNDIYKAPTNVLGVAFDDGPTAASSDLYSFLDQKHQGSTHFLIGTNILNYPDSIKQANEEGNQQFAVHTWSHTVQTTLTDEQVVAELGWTMQIIYDMTGKIPSLWRPPQGDVDNRVRGIAENVFGLTTVLWNKDSNDWCINDDGSSSCPGEIPGESDQSVGDALEGFIHDNINKEEGIIILEHELTSYSVQHFKNYYPELSGLGWDPKAIADIDGRSWYSNSNNGTSPTTNQTNMVYASAINPSSSSSSSTSSSSRTTSTSTLTSTSTQPPRSTKTAIVIQTPVNQLKSHTNASQKQVMPLTLLLSSLLVSLLV